VKKGSLVIEVLGNKNMRVEAIKRVAHIQRGRWIKALFLTKKQKRKWTNQNGTERVLSHTLQN